jgi:hypothetical protein|tara:strand:- start:49 stop:627 length:579 start_codon:yes stop_codon:yes gene_type:complete
MAKNKTFYTPAGPAAWIKVHEPDTTWKECGEYAVDLFLSPEDAKETLAIYDQVVKDTVKEEGGKPTKDIQYQLVSSIKSETLEKLAKTGFEPDPTWYRLKFKVDHKVKPKNGNEFENRVAVLDGNNHPIPFDPEDRLGNGSIIKIAYQPYGWCVSGKAGCKMRLRGIQVVDKKTYSDSGVAFESVTEEDLAF